MSSFEEPIANAQVFPLFQTSLLLKEDKFVYERKGSKLLRLKNKTSYCSVMSTWSKLRCSGKKIRMLSTWLNHVNTGYAVQRGQLKPRGKLLWQDSSLA